LRRRLAAPKRTEVTLPPSVGGDELEACLKAAALRSDAKGRVTFDLRQVTFASLDALTSMLCLFNRLAAGGAQVTLNWDEDQQSFGYAERMGFFGVLHDDVDVEPQRPPRGSSTFDVYSDRNPLLLELTPLPVNSQDAGDAALRKLATRLEENLSGRARASDAVGRIWTCASETVSNVYEHSESPVPALIAVQRYSSKERGVRLQLVIADAGLGLATTIRTGNPAAAGTKSDVDLIVAAFKQGLSSKLERGRGCGLTQCARLAALYAGNLRVRTGATWAKLITKSQKGWTAGFYDNEAAFVSGTQIVFDFYLDRVSERANLLH
jgi:hypothetical protein